MSKLKKLIEELCPKGVKNKKLKEVCDFVNGFAFRSSLFREGGEKIIRITNINGCTIDIDDVTGKNCDWFSSCCIHIL